MTCTEDSQQPQATTIAIAHPGPGERDLECLVCREPYSCARSPKLLSCQHAFCAVCLKLLLCVQADTWSISCPLCRKLTTVPGGLICSLRSQEEVVRWLAQPRPEVQLCPQGLAGAVTLSMVALPSSVGEDGLGTMSANRVAARRLAAHLLLLVLLIFLILPLIYPGIIRWVLALIIGLALLMALIFCCYPHGLSSSHRILLCGELKHSEIASIA
ncbi:E3 ubiquitin-protein ligase RNF186 [Ochotona princeps]|uniref:E3 ubiquitin-protein ligase RNF186 n=1 Tax=Ochotona princeps TaxID=9978 RepID=UPI00032AF6C2|nr:E3 ubiquitin-protein ligase RNF186 [Ochotona princeps]